MVCRRRTRTKTKIKHMHPVLKRIFESDIPDGHILLVKAETISDIELYMMRHKMYADVPFLYWHNALCGHRFLVGDNDLGEPFIVIPEPKFEKVQKKYTRKNEDSSSI
jgi:hypothetical protein